jgi:hypothetical protein
MQLNFPLANLLEFARTEDRGATWSRPVVVDAPPPNAVDRLKRRARLADGDLLGVFERIEIAADFSATEEFFATRSPDGGRTWLPRSRSDRCRSCRWRIPKPGSSSRSRDS